MEYWSVEVLDLVELDLFLYEWQRAELENRSSSVFIHQYSITLSDPEATTPSPHGYLHSQDYPFEVKSSSIVLGPDFILPRG